MNTVQTAAETEPGAIPPYMVMDAPRELRELREWVEHSSKPTADIDAFYTQLFESVSLAGCSAIDDLREFANDVGYGDALYGQHELLRHEQHRLAMLVMEAGYAITRELNRRCLYDSEGMFPYHFRACDGDGLLIFANYG